MKKIEDIIHVFELFCLAGIPVNGVIKDIYAELIDRGYLASELTDNNVVADILLVDIRYECPNEDLLEFLVFHINILARVDSSASLIVA